MKIHFSSSRGKTKRNFSSRISRDRNSCQGLALSCFAKVHIPPLSSLLSPPSKQCCHRRQRHQTIHWAIHHHMRSLQRVFCQSVTYPVSCVLVSACSVSVSMCPASCVSCECHLNICERTRPLFPRRLKKQGQQKWELKSRLLVRL